MKSIMRVVFLRATLTLLIVPPCSTPAQLLPLRYYTTKDGLISNWTTSVIQDSKGYLWVGTSDGISVYDGTSFSNYTTEDGLSNSFITVMRESEHHQGTIWIGTIRGLTRYHNGTFLKLPPESPLNSYAITSITEDTLGKLWCGTSGGLFCVQGESATEFKRRSHAGIETLNHRGLIWIATGRMIFFYTANGQLTDSMTIPLGNDESVESMRIDREGDIWIGGTLGTVLVFRDTTLLWKRKFSGAIYSALLDRRGFVWLSTSNGMLKVKKVDFLTGSADQQNAERGFPEIATVAVLDDHEGNIWFITYHKGLIKLVETGLQTIHIGASSYPAGLDPGGRLWLPSRGGVWEVWISGEEQWNSAFHQLSNPKKSGEAFLVVWDHQKRLWTLSRYFLRCYKVTTKGREKSRLQLVHALLPGREIPIGIPGRAYVDRNNRLWYSILDSSVVVVDLNSPPHIVEHFIYPRDLPLRSVRAIIQDRHGDVWLGDYSSGAVRVRSHSTSRPGQNWKKRAIEHFTTARGLPDDWIRSFCEDESGRLWIGTRYGGVAIYDGKQFENISMKDGLISNCIWQMARDSTGRMWLATSLGLMAINKDGSRESLRETAGQVIDFCAASRNGLLWFGSALENVSVYDMTKRMPNLVPPPVYISQLTVNDNAVPTGGNLEFSYTQNNCLIHYIGISLRDEQGVRYQYRLNNSDWSRPTALRSVSFPVLSPGEYTFEVRAINGDGISSERPAKIVFTILPPFWKQWWFFTLSAAAVSLVVALLYRYRVNHLLKQERLRFRIASDLHDDVGTNLSSILVTSQIMQRQTRLSDEVLLHVKDIQSIAAETQDALRDIVWMLNPGNDYLGDFVLKMKDTAERLLQNMRVRFTVPGGSLLEKVSIDFKRNVFLIFKESLNNIVRHSQASEVLIEIAYNSGTFVLQIHDNGQGFSMGEHGTGIGLSNLQRRASQIGGTVQVVSRPGWGTTVRLEVKNHANAQ